ncbi:maleylpyruvate isomerase family mycothiol-dependent enzyme, partial [Streptomyces sp. NPDC005803]
MFLRWFEESSATLLTALRTDPSTSAWTFHPPHTVGFWQRRRALE